MLWWCIVFLFVPPVVFSQTDTRVTQQDGSYPIYWSLVPLIPPTVSNTQTSSFGSCICKTLIGQCTPNCCCDTDCDTDTLNRYGI
jgi:hypothetical protein